MPVPVLTHKSAQPWLVLDDIAIRSGERVVFSNSTWTWRHGEQWTIIGPNGSGKSLLALAIAGRAPVVHGEIRYSFDAGEVSDRTAPEDMVALLSPHVQRELMIHESSFYQSRWHSGINEGYRTVAQFLSQASVEEINPFEIRTPTINVGTFRQKRREVIGWLGIKDLYRRKLIYLSNGEHRKVLLARTLLRGPRLLILDDPFSGLDSGTRIRLRGVIKRLMQSSLPVLLVTSRADEVPASTTHLLLVRNHRILAQGTKSLMLDHPLICQLAAGTEAKPHTRLNGEGRSNKLFAAGSPILALKHVTVRRGAKRILDDVTWTVRRGEHWALLGPNGSGKTTLLSLLQGDNPQAYAVDLSLFGSRILSTQNFWECRQKMGWLSPELHHHYPLGWSCLQVVCSGFFNSVGLYSSCTSRQRSAASLALRQFSLHHSSDLSFGELSLGDQRLALLARAMVKKPRLLILDEPCQGLDAGHRQQVLEKVDLRMKNSSTSLIFVTHHPKELPDCITHFLVLKEGRVCQMSARPC